MSLPPLFPFSHPPPIFSVPRFPTFSCRTQRGSLALLRMRSLCQLDRGLEAATPNRSSAPKASQLFRPLLLVESGKGSVSAERASVSSLSVSAPDELADVVAWTKLRTQMPAPCHSQAGSIPVSCHLLLSSQASVNVDIGATRHW
ncbi:uncharacterized protein LOC141577158 isoform X3 [Camelus bactrianus]|uniref:Uncharacterized protein LOC141577158 isoform X3 n=1 Tax=Camelus bactrianus TaxID=9837 RepID=A0AC58Q551_CAMBA